MFKSRLELAHIVSDAIDSDIKVVQDAALYTADHLALSDSSFMDRIGDKVALLIRNRGALPISVF